MASTGELVREAIDLNERGLSTQAFFSACQAFRSTLVKSSGKEEPVLLDYKAFIDEYWDILLFMSFPGLSSPYLDIQFVIKEISLNPRRNYTYKEIVVYLVSYVIRNQTLPTDVGFHTRNDFEKSADRLLVPSTLITALLAFVVVHPENLKETIPDKYWISIADFKMFISEIWGRIDLAERVRRFYSTR